MMRFCKLTVACIFTKLEQQNSLMKMFLSGVNLSVTQDLLTDLHIYAFNFS